MNQKRASAGDYRGLDSGRRPCCWSRVGCGKLRARDQLNKGVQSFKNAKYEEAIEHFKNAVSLDPSLLTARLYLGTAYMQTIYSRRRYAGK